MSFTHIFGEQVMLLGAIIHRVVTMLEPRPGKVHISYIFAFLLGAVCDSPPLYPSYDHNAQVYSPGTHYGPPRVHHQSHMLLYEL